MSVSYSIRKVINKSTDIVNDVQDIIKEIDAATGAYGSGGADWINGIDYTVATLHRYGFATFHGIALDLPFRKSMLDRSSGNRVKSAEIRERAKVMGAVFVPTSKMWVLPTATAAGIFKEILNPISTGPRSTRVESFMWMRQHELLAGLYLRYYDEYKPDASYSNAFGLSSPGSTGDLDLVLDTGWYDALLNERLRRWGCNWDAGLNSWVYCVSKTHYSKTEHKKVIEELNRLGVIAGEQRPMGDVEVPSCVIVHAHADANGHITSVNYKKPMLQYEPHSILAANRPHYALVVPNKFVPTDMFLANPFFPHLSGGVCPAARKHDLYLDQAVRNASWAAFGLEPQYVVNNIPSVVSNEQHTLIAEGKQIPLAEQMKTHKKYLEWTRPCFAAGVTGAKAHVLVTQNTMSFADARNTSSSAPGWKQYGTNAAHGMSDLVVHFFIPRYNQVTGEEYTTLLSVELDSRVHESTYLRISPTVSFFGRYYMTMAFDHWTARRDGWRANSSLTMKTARQLWMILFKRATRAWAYGEIDIKRAEEYEPPYTFSIDSPSEAYLCVDQRIRDGMA
jgi:hypothetical protein